MNLLDLPTEIIFEILSWLDGDSLQSCLSVSKCLHGILNARPEFEYRYRLEKQGMVNTCDGQYPYERRILTLKQFTRFWRASEIDRVPNETYPIAGDCIAYELVAGVFAKTDGLTLTIQWLPSFLKPARRLIRSQAELRIPIKDFALDPTQDLIVLIEADNLPHIIPQGRKTNLHVRTLSTNVPHPEAHKPVIEFTIPYNPRGNELSAVTIQLADDLLSLFFSSGPGSPHLLLWDWKSGTIILNSMNSFLQLPSGTRAFELLGSRSYAILSTADCGSIYIYNIDYPKKPVAPPFCVARLNFPELLPGIELSYIYSHTGPFLGQPRRDGIFTTAPESRVYVISIHFLNTPLTHATFFISHSAFARYTQMRTVAADGLDVPWETWSHHKYLFTPMRLASNWLRYVQGNRVLVPPDDERRSITILDFNTNLAPFQDDVGNDFNIYCQPLRHILLPRRWTLALKTTCSSFLIGEDFVLGLRTSGNWEETIGSLEIFSMYPTKHVT